MLMVRGERWQTLHTSKLAARTSEGLRAAAHWKTFSVVANLLEQREPGAGCLRERLHIREVYGRLNRPEFSQPIHPL